MARLHRIVGLLFTGMFFATGLYMRATFPAAWQGDPGMRMMFRSAHVYILLAALLNVLAAPSASAPTAVPKLRSAGSILVMLSPVLFTLSFFVEPAPDHFKRPFVLFGLVCAALGTLLLAIAASRPGKEVV